ncbi:hypothetical protein Patl1_02480 [Pistacia atlantica]|uniref:Uncharacterized protein n=1 Tax=Pistacia atlantica TaxID=434234 RepID=A0ACC1CCN9_9ROSI|nr:hypothetical protein Patl1_02480 [Pistacia atlantica]
MLHCSGHMVGVDHWSFLANSNSVYYHSQNKLVVKAAERVKKSSNDETLEFRLGD